MFIAALLVRAWIEITMKLIELTQGLAALLVRAWIEIRKDRYNYGKDERRSPRESVD